jgi:peptide/nickel transport system permease protein
MALDEIALTPEPTTDIGFNLKRTRFLTIDLWLPAGVLILLVLACFFGGPLFGLPGPSLENLNLVLLPPLTHGHLLGTDQLGDDMLSRTLAAGRISLEVGVGAVALGFLVGGTFGVIAGYFGNATEALIMRILDVLLSFPPLVLALVIATYLGPTEFNEILAIAFFTVPANARLARASTLRMREQGFITSSILAGASHLKTVFEHVVPNVVPALLTFSFVNISAAMLIDAALSFLGAGVRPPTPTWGNMIASGESYFTDKPWVVFVPGVFLLIAILALNLLGDAFRRRIEAR